MSLNLKTSLDVINELKKKKSFTLRIQNNTSETQEANILSVPNLADNSNATRKFSYPLAGETFAVSSFTIQFRANAQSSFTTTTVLLPVQTIQGVVNALTNLGLGSWYADGTDLITWNNNYVWGDLVIGAATYSGEIDTTFVVGTGFNGDVYAIAQQADGKLLCGGLFTTYNGTGAARIVRLNTDGSLDGTFVYGAGFDAAVNDIQVQADGFILVGGAFSSYDGNAVAFLTRLDSTGTIDPGFSTAATLTDEVMSIAIQTDNKIMIGGRFTTAGGSVRIARLNSDGTEDGTFVSGTGFNAEVNKILLDAGGNVVVSGLFTTYNATPYSRFIRLTTLGAIDGTLVIGTGFNNRVKSFAIDATGNFICVGDFTTYDGTAASRIIRITSLGAIDGTFVYGTGLNGSAFDVIVSADTKIMVVGAFTAYDANAVGRIVRINPADGSIDTTLVQGTGFDGLANRVLQQADTRLVIVGQFTSYDANAYAGIIRLYA
jgi:uncharacterized delta-60 repeat protein